MTEVVDRPGASRMARLRARLGLEGRRGVLTGLLAVILGAWAVAVVASVLASGAQGRAVAALWALGGHGHAVAVDVAAGTLGLAAALALVALAWIVMTAAMMLPSSVPMITLFVATAQKVPGWRLSFCYFLLGYFTVWVGFGMLAFGVDLGVNALAQAWPWLADNWQVVVATALAMGAIWQLTPLKDACLKECRHPVSFLLRYYRRGGSAGWQLGIRHGVFCVGCCWALMLVMVVSGAAQLALMGILALIMFVEKAMPWGEKVVRPVGIAFAVAAVTVLFLGSGAHTHLG
ncbi:DUF2182 domain-containing protein [Pseudonocardia sp.]|uniref:DUF2182 domain-containing protein n=1 Tax=Pseudonocardia sp. TaxID=60912 RepID=UPI003D125B61